MFPPWGTAQVTDAMPTTARMLTDYPDVLLDVIAELRNADPQMDEGSGGGAADRTMLIARLAEELTNPTSVQFAWQEAVDTDPRCEAAIEALAATGGEMPETRFSREFGSIRQMGPAKLVRETPWLYPESVAEILYYQGLLGLGFTGAGQEAKSIVYIPADVLPWLPRPNAPIPEGGLAVQPAAPPPRSRMLNADSSFLEDAGTLIGFLYSEQLHVASGAPNAEDVERLIQRLHFPFEESMQEQNVRLGLLLHLANRLGWLRRGEGGLVQLTGNRVREFLEMTRAEQRQALFMAWRDSPEWNDLCRMPGMECGPSVNADPSKTRAAALELFGRLQPGAWYRISEVVAAIKTSSPEFQRPTAQFDAWDLRNSNTQESLRGFEQWDAVEGALLGWLLRGPLHWLDAVDLAEPSSGDDWLVSLTNWGARWLGQDVAQPHESSARQIQVGDDFRILLPLGTPLNDRFRVERFAQWEQSYPEYIYRITQRSLKHAEENGISAEQVLRFLHTRTTKVPEKVAGALTRQAKVKS